MKFEKIILMSIISVIALIGYIFISDKSIVSDSLSNVSVIKLFRDNASIELHAGEDQEDIKVIYETVERTRIGFYEGDDGESHNESEPGFIVEIHYKSGKVDHIMTSETGEVIYREGNNSGSFYEDTVVSLRI